MGASGAYPKRAKRAEGGESQRPDSFSLAISLAMGLESRAPVALGEGAAIMAGSEMPGVMDAGPFRGCHDGSRFRGRDANRRRSFAQPSVSLRIVVSEPIESNHVWSMIKARCPTKLDG